MADRSVKIPKGEITDVLIRVGEFIYPVDFVVLETQPVQNHRAQTPVILRRPFLATANAIINCRNGSMRLTFEDMTKEVNVFHLGKQPRDLENDSFDVNLIKGLTSEHVEEVENESEEELSWSLMTSTLIRLLNQMLKGPLIPPLFFPCTMNNQ